MLQLRHHDYVLKLRHTFRLARGASDTRKTLVLELEQGGVVGLGEAAPIERYGQDCDSAARAAESMAARLTNPAAYDSAANSVAVPGEAAAEAAPVEFSVLTWNLELGSRAAAATAASETFSGGPRSDSLTTTTPVGSG